MDRQNSDSKEFLKRLIPHKIIILIFIFSSIGLFFFAESSKKIPEYARLCNKTALKYEQKRNYPKAIRYYQKAIEHNPSFAEAYYHLGEIYGTRLGERKKQMDFFQKAFELKTDRPDVYSFLSADYAEKKEFDKALRVMLQATVVINANGDLYLQLGKIYEQLDNPREAMASYRKALFYQTDPTELYYRLAKLSYEINDLWGTIEFMQFLFPPPKDFKKIISFEIKDNPSNK